MKLRPERSWGFLKKFNIGKIPPRIQWESIELMKAKARTALMPIQHNYNVLERRWEHKLKVFGGDLSTLDWSEFRPLRLSREEDWSDWLAWLLKTSTTGDLAKTLFGEQVNRPAFVLKLPDVKREPATKNRHRRGDILVTWKSAGIAVNIEVKVGDEQFEKTFDTAKELKKENPANQWYDFILMPDESLPEWETVTIGYVDKTSIKVILWRDVVRGLRSCLWQENELLVWRVWAWTFCSAIEERVLCLSKPKLLRTDVGKLQMSLSWIDLLELKAGGK